MAIGDKQKPVENQDAQPASKKKAITDSLERIEPNLVDEKLDGLLKEDNSKANTSDQ